MSTSTLTDKGQTTVPRDVRLALKVKPRQRLNWSVREDGMAVVSPQRSALDLYGSLKSPKKFTNRAAEREAVGTALGHRAGKAASH